MDRYSSLLWWECGTAHFKTVIKMLLSEKLIVETIYRIYHLTISNQVWSVTSFNGLYALLILLIINGYFGLDFSVILYLDSPPTDNLCNISNISVNYIVVIIICWLFLCALLYISWTFSKCFHSFNLHVFRMFTEKSIKWLTSKGCGRAGQSINLKLNLGLICLNDVKKCKLWTSLFSLTRVNMIAHSFVFCSLKKINWLADWINKVWRNRGALS